MYEVIILLEKMLEPSVLDSRSFSAQARVYANRFDMLKELGSKYGEKFSSGAEIGVGLGKFSKSIINEFSLDEFTAFDSFELHELPAVWGRPSDEVFRGRTHRAFYEQLMSDSGCRINIHEGDSRASLGLQGDSAFDFVYVDGDHSYEYALVDGRNAVRVARCGGLVVFNDYVLFDYNGNEYGVVQAVNQILGENPLFRVVGFALQRRMYCDIAIEVTKS